ncbi:AAA family ATPase [Kaistia dalseonensis]|uniref:Adenylate kinase n=1 Tax=Kaistia dalseonensis TaxID=410840 RepID=A0ABU0HFG2_9HYPH|nr:AAA family ATPase [Kaistia dalseonensis]MCX5497826.1 AAA family ATPase [Kaistia dalseonensis]MDQ0440470.1 hypothetical protein [Kaistia dalseonensis]
MQADYVRTLIIGNCGAGKSWLAERIARNLDITAIDLDAINWENGGYERARDKDVAREIVRSAAAEPRWVIEGVYGWLAEQAVGRATALIWLDLDVDKCLAALKARGPSPGANATLHAELITWAAEYPTRQNSSSLSGHHALFSSFRRRKIRLHARNEVHDFLATAFAD